LSNSAQTVPLSVALVAGAIVLGAPQAVSAVVGFAVGGGGSGNTSTTTSTKHVTTTQRADLEPAEAPECGFPGADAAVVDTRVLLAHRLGADEAAWPAVEDRFASDLLAPDGIRDPWLRELAASALEASVPVLLGGHSVVGPGLRFVVANDRWT